MWDEKTWDLLNQNYEAGRASKKASQPQVTNQKKKKGFWLDQISTGGGIGGALGGAAAGAALGSVVPIAGTAVGGILGALLGGGLGSAGGEVAENAITGDRLDQNVLKEGLIGGATSLPFGAGFKLAKAGLQASTGIGKKAAGDLIQEAGVQTIGKRTVARGSSLGQQFDEGATSALGRLQAGKTFGQKGTQSANDVATKIMASQSGMTASQSRKQGLRPIQTFGNIYGRTGLSSLDDMAEVGRNLTGAGDDSILDTLTRAAFEESPRIKLGDIRKTAQTIMDDGTSLLSDSERKRVLSNMKNASVAIHGGASGSLDPLGSASKALEQANAFRGTAADLKHGFNITPKDKQMARIYDGVAADIEKSLYSSPGVNSSIPLLTKAGRDDILFKAQAARQAGNEAQAKAYEKIAQEVGGVKSVKDLRSLKRDFVEIGKIDKATAEAEGARTLTGGQFATTAGDIASRPMKGIGLLADKAAPKAAGILKSLTELKGGGAPRIGQSIPGTTARQSLGRGAFADAPVQEDLSQFDAGLVDDPTQSNSGDQTLEEPSIGGITKSQLEQAMMAAMADGNSDAFSQLKQMYSMLPDPASSQLSAAATRQAAQSANGEATINQLESLLNNAGGGQGAFGGRLSSLAGSLDLNNQARTYNDLAKGSVAQIAKALGETGALSDSDIKTYGSMLPRLTDTPQVAKAKLAALRERLAVARQNTLSYGGGDSTFEESQMNAGY